MLKVMKAGLVHEYTGYDTVAHCEAHIACLEKLAPLEGSVVRAKANACIAKFGTMRSMTYHLQRECSEALDKVAPAGMYFGAPSTQSNMAGFWPSAWISGTTSRNPKGVPDSVARSLGSAIIQ